ncbi:butyrophilin subfamily 3 member A2-like [Tautogolabrus adspersus]
MSGIKRVMFFYVLFYLQGFAKGGAADVKTVFCGIEESCVLPCTFTAGEDVVIHWKETTTADTLLHYYHNQDHPEKKAPRFRNRTSLISEKEASLRLKGVTNEDEGRYECYVSIPHRPPNQSTMDLKVDAPPRKVQIQQVGNRITCSSERIYPQPELTWSSSPPTNLTVADTTTAQQKGKLYSINSSLIALTVSNLDYSCTISTGRKERKATLFNTASINISDSKTTIPCTSSNIRLKSLIWTFNHSQNILIQTTAEVPFKVSEEWRKHVKDVSESGSLVLQDITSLQEGIYTCELSTAEETFVQSTVLMMKESQSTPHVAGITVGVIISVVIAICILVFIYKKRKKGQIVKEEKPCRTIRFRVNHF